MQRPSSHVHRPSLAHKLPRKHSRSPPPHEHKSHRHKRRLTGPLRRERIRSDECSLNTLHLVCAGVNQRLAASFLKASVALLAIQRRQSLTNVLRRPGAPGLRSTLLAPCTVTRIKRYTTALPFQRLQSTLSFCRTLQASLAVFLFRRFTTKTHLVA